VSLQLVIQCSLYHVTYTFYSYWASHWQTECCHLW